MFQPHKKHTPEALNRLQMVARCLKCDADISSYAHLEPGFDTTWFCKNCGQGHDITIQEEGIEITIVEGFINQRTFDLIELKKNPNQRVFLVHRGIRSLPDMKEDSENNEQKKNFINEHTCPINVVRRTEMILVMEEDVMEGHVAFSADPHGLFEFAIELGVIPMDHDQNHSEELIQHLLGEKLGWKDEL